MSTKEFVIVEKTSRNPMNLKNLTLDVNIDGFLCETTLTISFSTNDEKGSEATLTFPLDEGAIICGFSTDIDGVMVQGVITGKEQAQVAFENAVRSTVPGKIAIMEHIDGNMFRSRIFPVQKYGRTVTVKWSQDIRNNTYIFPFTFKSLQKLELSITVHLPSEIQQVPTITSDFKDIKLDISSNDGYKKSYVASIQKSNLSIKQSLIIKLPPLTIDYIIEKDDKNNILFLINSTPQSTPNPQNKLNQTKYIGILWDASRSLNKKDKSIAIKILQMIFQRYQNLKIELIVFRNTPSPPKEFTITQGNSPDFFTFLNSSIRYDGATNLGAIKFTKPSQKGQPSYYLLFSDGLCTLGQEIPKQLDVPVYSFCTVSPANHTVLKLWARNSGGDFFNLLDIPESEWKKIVNGLGDPSFGFISSQVDQKIQDVYPSLPVSLPSGNFKICGYIHSDPGTVVSISLNFGYGSNVTSTKTYKLVVPDLIRTGLLLPRFLASKKMDEILLLEAAKSELMSLGKKYSLVTPATSILVLDSLEQYLKYEVEPHISLPYHQAYLDILSQLEEVTENKLDSKMKFVKSIWDRLISWWRTQYPLLDYFVPNYLHFGRFDDFKLKSLDDEIHMKLNIYFQELEILKKLKTSLEISMPIFHHHAENCEVKVAGEFSITETLNVSLTLLPVKRAFSDDSDNSDSIELIAKDDGDWDKPPTPRLSQPRFQLQAKKKPLQKQRSMQRQRFDSADHIKAPKKEVLKEDKVPESKPILQRSNSRRASPVRRRRASLARSRSRSPPATTNTPAPELDFEGFTAPVSTLATSINQIRRKSIDMPRPPVLSTTKKSEEPQAERKLVRRTSAVQLLDRPFTTNTISNERTSTFCSDDMGDLLSAPLEQTKSSDIYDEAFCEEFTEEFIDNIECEGEEDDFANFTFNEPAPAPAPDPEPAPPPPVTSTRKTSFILSQTSRTFKPKKVVVSAESCEDDDDDFDESRASVSSGSASDDDSESDSEVIIYPTEAPVVHVVPDMKDLKVLSLESKQISMVTDDRFRVVIQPWTVHEPYMSALDSCSNLQDIENTYYRLSDEWGYRPLFFFDVGVYLYLKNHSQLSEQVLSNLVELDLANEQYMRLLAFQFEMMGLIDYSINLYERVLKTRTEEPQTYRDLALLLMKRRNDTDIQNALTHLTHVVQGDWDIRFTQVEAVALVELCRYEKDLQLHQIVANDKLWDMIKNYDVPLSIPMACDIRIVLTWDADMIDMELHVFEPNDQHCYSFRNHTSNGGMMSKDMTGGLGPETYLIKTAIRGEYQVKAKLFASKGRTIFHGVTAMIRIFTNYGKEDEREYLHVVRLSQDKEMANVATIYVN